MAKGIKPPPPSDVNHSVPGCMIVAILLSSIVGGSIGALAAYYIHNV